MTLVLIGLGKMGRAVADKLARAGGRGQSAVSVVGVDPDPEARAAAERAGITAVPALADAISRGESPQTVWLMVPAERVEDVVGAVGAQLASGDLLVDGGNTYFRDSERRAPELKQRGIAFLDVGVSGGPGGGETGFSLMIGGEAAAYQRIEPMLTFLAAPSGAYGRVGPAGAGHFAKMVHNGIEYGMMEALAEGVDVLRHGPFPSLDLAAVARVWKGGSVIRSYLVDLLAEILATENLDTIVGRTGATGEGEWTVQTARELGLEVPAIAVAVERRKESRKRELFAAKIAALLRNRFGGHAIERKETR